MSAVVCGGKRCYFEELPLPSKRIKSCCSSSSSPTRALSSSPSSPTQLLHQLSFLFPHMETEVLERALQECGYDVDVAIKRLNELCIGSAEENGVSVEEAVVNVEQGVLEANEEAAAAGNLPAGDSSSQNNLPAEGAEWVEIFVKEMMSATSLDDARGRARRVLEFLEQSISGRARQQAGESFQKENMMLKEQIEVLMRENTILKRAVAIQHERQEEHNDRNRELQQLKQLVAQYQEQLRVLEVNNYALSMHLRQAQQSNNISIPGRFNPDVF